MLILCEITLTIESKYTNNRSSTKTVTYLQHRSLDPADLLVISSHFCKKILNKTGTTLLYSSKVLSKFQIFYTFVIVHTQHCFIITFRRHFPLALHPGTHTEYTNVSVQNTKIYFIYIKIVHSQGDMFRPSLGRPQTLKENRSKIT